MERHYLHSARVGGQSSRYVAELNGEWIPLLCSSAPALHLKAREKKIGWTSRHRARRLGFVVKNSRFLVPRERHQYSNLASRVLLWLSSVCLPIGKAPGNIRSREHRTVALRGTPFVAPMRRGASFGEG